MFNELTPEEEYVILHKGTERAFTGEYFDHKADGAYVCRRCDSLLYLSKDKFDSGCGWPSFDDDIPAAVKRETDADGRRTEILCQNCGGHLGHVFHGERFTEKNTRHCVNSLSIRFLPVENLGRGIFASGCFWGTEYWLQQQKGVSSAVSGYIGGHVDQPTYQQVCTGGTGHAEAVEVYYDKSKTDYETLAKIFFETHDPSQVNRQGPDIGTQYRSGIFYLDDEQKEIAQKLIDVLKGQGVDVVTELTEATEFFPAELYHQDYYFQKGTEPYCHIYQKKF